MVSERFEVSRNFCNKLWNAARFVLINLNGYSPGEVPENELTVEDRWVLSRLSTVTQQTTAALEGYHFADAARALYDFAWDEFCSFYVEMAKGRLQNEARREVAQRVIAYVLDKLLRLLLPMLPFITEEVWRLLNQVAPIRGIDDPEPSTESIIVAPWPTPDESRQDAEIEARFSKFQAALGALREIRSRQNIPSKNAIHFCVRCDHATAQLLNPMSPYFHSMANAHPTAVGPAVEPPPINATISLPGMEIIVDLAGSIDVAAEIARNEKEEQKLLGLIQGKEAKLNNASFVDRAPPNIVATEREGLAKLHEQLATARAALQELRKAN